MGEKGQVTIFVIIAILIVVAGVLIFQFVPSVQEIFSGIETNPNIYLQECLEDDLVDAIELISIQGGELSPEHYYLLNGEKLTYLCYSGEYFKYCNIQKPFVKESMEKELTEDLKSRVNSCLDSLKEDYESKNYQVNLQKGDSEIKILPDRTELVIESKLTIKKAESTTFDSFTISNNNNLYQMLGVSRSIVEFETSIGEADPTSLMSLYRELKIEKIKQTDETKVYKITDKKTGDKFQFASRSLAFPPGYI